MHRLADTNTRSKRDTRLGNDRQACRKPRRTLTSAQLCFHSCAPEFMHIYRITGCIACKLLRDESPWLVTPVGARARACAHTRMRSIRHCLPTSPRASKWMASRGIVHHRGSLSNVFFTHLTEATDSIRRKETKHDATYESRCDFPRLRRWACLETTDGIGMIPNDCCAGILFYIRQLATVARFDVSFFFYLASISFEKERIYGASEF